MNKAVASGITDKDKLAQVALNSRTKEGLKVGEPPVKLIKDGGDKIAKLFTTLKDMTIKGAKEGAEIVKKNLIPTIVITVGLLVGSYALYKKFKNK